MAATSLRTEHLQIMLTPEELAALREAQIGLGCRGAPLGVVARRILLCAVEHVGDWGPAQVVASGHHRARRVDLMAATSLRTERLQIMLTPEELAALREAQIGLGCRGAPRGVVARQILLCAVEHVGDWGLAPELFDV